MKTTWNWTKFINVTQLKQALTSTEMATILGLAADQVLDWHDYKGRLVVSISGRGGRFVSYWQLNRAVEWLVQAIKTCWDSATWLQLQKWIKTVWKGFKYSPEAREQVEQALQQQQARLEDRAKPEDKANLFVNIIRDCRDHRCLDLAGQLFSRQRAQFNKYPDLIERVMEAGLQQRAYLRSIEEQNQQAIAPTDTLQGRREQRHAGVLPRVSESNSARQPGRLEQQRQFSALESTQKPAAAIWFSFS
jgi:hypothetical protein